MMIAAVASSQPGRLKKIPYPIFTQNLLFKLFIRIVYSERRDSKVPGEVVEAGRRLRPE